MRLVMARERRVTVRLTEEQYQEIEKRRGNTPKSEFLYLLLLEWLNRKSEIEKELNRIRKEQQKKNEFCRKLYAELGKIGSNINQIARSLNKGGRAVSSSLTDLVIETMDLITELKERLRDGDIKAD
jgi:nitrogen-specific signal transduction histidine kinase